MLHRLLQLCLVFIAAIFLAGDLWACPNHAAVPQHLADGTGEAAGKLEPVLELEAIAAISAGRASHEAEPPSTKVAPPAGPALTAIVKVSGGARPAGHHECCGTSGCTHTGACAGGCCTSGHVSVGTGGRQQERKLTFIPPHRPAMAMMSLVMGPTLADGDRDRRRWRDAEAMMSLLREPRLQRVVRLTI